MDFAATLAGGQRLRGSAFAQGEVFLLALRLLPRSCPQLATLGAPPVIAGTAYPATTGLILVTGATGSGKSTTLAAMVGYLNQHADGHILTLEDPVEYLYPAATLPDPAAGDWPALSVVRIGRCAAPCARIRT